MAIDPSLRSTGYYLNWCDVSGVIDCSKTSHTGALLRIGQQIESHIASCELVLCEDYTFSRHSRSTSTMGEVKGILTYLARSHGAPIVGVNVQTWRSIFPGIRDIDKKTNSDAYIELASNICDGKRFTSTDDADACMIYHAVVRLIEKSPMHKLVALIQEMVGGE